MQFEVPPKVLRYFLQERFDLVIELTSETRNRVLGREIVSDATVL